MAEKVIQRCVFPIERRLQPLYYRMDRPQDSRLVEPEPPDRRSIWITRGSKLITDTYFNSLFESYWRKYTQVGRLQLRLELTGRGTILLVRRTLATGIEIVGEVAFDADGTEVVLDVPEPQFHHRESGALHFDIIAHSPNVRLARAEWVALDVEPEPVSLIAGFCTFNRERFLLNNVRALLDDPEVIEQLGRIVVVDQGTSKVKGHAAYDFLQATAGDKLQVVEQENYGGAGGFTRTIIEARETPGATHMLLMDDDAVTEPESVFRVAAFQSLAKQDMGVGGQMLDMLRPLEVYESGARVDPATLGVTSPINRMFAGTTPSLEPFLEVAHVHYNAWWFFAFPLRVVDRIGLPMPLFIRGDDVEFGCRMHRAGYPTTTVPGMGIWHEPFYLKRGGWQAYYDMRNMMILTSVHFPMGRKQVVRTFLKRFVMQLLSHNYSEAAILCEAVTDYCRGPALADADPKEIHRKLVAIKKEMGLGTVSRSRCLPVIAPAPPPVTRFQIKKRLLGSLWRQFMRPSVPADAQPGCVIPDEYATWWHLGTADVVAAEDWHTEDHRVYRRSREMSRALLKQATKAALQLYRTHERVAADWRAAHARLTSGDFWDRYLKIEREGMEGGAEGDRSRNAA